MTEWYNGLFNILWYTRSPCFDIRNVTSNYEGYFTTGSGIPADAILAPSKYGVGWDDGTCTKIILL